MKIAAIFISTLLTSFCASTLIAEQDVQFTQKVNTPMVNAIFETKSGRVVNQFITTVEYKIQTIK